MSEKTKPILDITMQRSALMAQLAAAERIATDKKVVIAVLSSMYLIATDKTIHWWVNNTDMWRGGVIEPESVIQPGAALLPVTRAAAMLKACADGLVRLTFTDKDVKIVASGFAAKIPTMNPRDYPQVPTVPDVGLEIPAATLSRLIGFVEPVSSPNDTKYFMRGSYFALSGDGILMVSTNGATLAKASVLIPGWTPSAEAAYPAPVILPKPSLSELLSMLKSAEGAVKYTISEEKHVFSVGSDVLFCRSIMDKFPAWERILPPDVTTRIVCKRSTWLDVVKRVIVASDVESRRMLLSFEGGKMLIAAGSKGGGEAAERIPVDQKGPDCDVHMNGIYLRHFLEAASSDGISLEIKSPSFPFIFRPEEHAKEIGGIDYLFMIAAISPPADQQVSMTLADGSKKVL